MWKRQRLLKQDDDAGDCRDAYVWSGGSSRVRRLLPSTDQAIFTANASKPLGSAGQLPPVLTSFLAAVGKLPHGSGAVEDQSGHAENTQGSNGGKSTIAAIDDPGRSTLSTGQRQRYLKLLSTREEWRPQERKEFKKLSLFVKAEQKDYRQAVLEFWEANRERVLVGFSRSSQSLPAAEFVNAAASVGPGQKHWKGKKYGKCLQVISLELPGQQAKSARWDVDQVESCDVPITEDTPAKQGPKQQGVRLPKVGSQISRPKEQKPLILLKDDDMALTLAKRTKACIVTSLETLETLLNVDHTQWLIPLQIRDGIAMLDYPIPQSFYSPRACLSRGLEVGLMQSLDNNGTSPAADKSGSQPYRYVLLTLPHSVGTSSARKPRSKRLKVLVRVPRQATRTRVHLDYFPERGDEASSSYEQSLWILDSFLFARSIVARVDPQSCRILKWEETSLAHALVPSDGATKGLPDPVDHWYYLARLLDAVPSIGQQGTYMLCAPARGDSPMPLSASVHMETQNDHGAIDIEKELVRAGEVPIGPEAIQRTMNEWKWTSGGVPFTFPPPTRTGKSEMDLIRVPRC